MSYPPRLTAHVPSQTFLTRVVLVPPLREKYAAIQKERAEADGGAGDAMDLS